MTKVVTFLSFLTFSLSFNLTTFSCNPSTYPLDSPVSSPVYDMFVNWVDD